MLLAGIVDQDVDASELVDGLTHRALAKLLVAEISGNGDCAAAFGFDDLLGPGRIVMLTKIKDGDIGALAREQRRHGPADAAVGAGDQRDLALQPSGTRIARLPIGFRLE